MAKRRQRRPQEEEENMSRTQSRKPKHIGGHRGNMPPVVPLLLAAALVTLGVCLGFSARRAEPPAGEAGAYAIPQGSMSDEEALAMVDEMAEASRITVSLAPEMALAEDGRLRVNLVVPEGNNGLSERVEVEQDGSVVYRSGVVDPGYVLEWGEGSSAHAGAATATVYAIRDGADFGNPVSVEVAVVGL